MNVDAEKKARKKVYNSKAYKTSRIGFLSENPLCALCEAEGKLTLAAHTHHVVEITQDPDRSVDTTNYLPLCRAHHSKEHQARRHGKTLGLGSFEAGSPAKEENDNG